MANPSDNDTTDMNRDPISGAPGAHPIGTGVGATGGAAAGAAIGAVGGPVGVVIGGAVGAIVGGLAGKAAGEAVNPTAEAEYWKSAYANEPYYNKQYSYDDYSPAYKLGYMAPHKYSGQSFDSVQSSLEHDWNATKGTSRMAWSDAKGATKAAWHRVERALPGDADGDGI
jgi:phage tail tape-measure protein